MTDDLRIDKTKPALYMEIDLGPDFEPEIVDLSFKPRHKPIMIRVGAKVTVQGDDRGKYITVWSSEDMYGFRVVFNEHL